MKFSLPSLPYEKEDLEPYVSKVTIGFHYDKHHKTYLDNLNSLLPGSVYEKIDTLEEVILASHGKSPAVFNNASQVWNHTFFWYSMKKNGGGHPYGKISSHIEKSFGGYENFVTEFKQNAGTQFGSGWVWLVQDVNLGELKVVKTGNAENPITNGLMPLVTCDVWEHAYYLDYQNRRLDFVNAFLNNLINWDFVNGNLV